MKPQTPQAPGGYFNQTRSWTYSAALALPVLVLYEVGVTLVDTTQHTGIRNGADVLLQGLLSFLGRWAPLLVPAVVAVTLLVLAWRERAVHLRRGYVVAAGVESLAYAAIFGGVVGRLTALVLPSAGRHLAPGMGGLPLWAQLVLSLGAGLYEEILFRGLVQGGLRAFAGSVLGLRPWVRDLGSVVLAAAIFSAYHHVGPYGDPFSLGVFTFRLIAGLVLSGLMVLRGFGITVLTHALYDMLFSLGLS